MRDLPDWTIHFTDEMPERLRGVTRWEDKTVWVRKGLSQADRRSVIEHERQHILRGPGGLRHPEERAVRAETARHLITLPALAEALKWSLDETELADELWVSVSVVRCRLDGLTQVEKDWISGQLDTDL